MDEEFQKRLRKTLYYGKNPLTERPSLPVTELAVELLQVRTSLRVTELAVKLLQVRTSFPVLELAVNITSGKNITSGYGTRR